MIQLTPILAAALAATAAAPPTVDTLAGRYAHHFRNSMMDGKAYWSDDVVEIVPFDAAQAYVRFDLSFANGHTCTLAGVARAKDDTLVYRDPPGLALYGDKPCVLSIRRNGARLGWSDDGSCRGHCGECGSLTDGFLPWSSKRAITYMARLKASAAYKQALKAWSGGAGLAP